MPARKYDWDTYDKHLKDNYKTKTARELSLELNVPIRIIQQRIGKLKLKKNKERLASCPIGYINPKSGCIKTEKGWVHLGKMLNVPRGHYPIHLDGDKTNIDKNNIAVVSYKIAGKMTANDFWSKDPELTKTALIWCELDNLMESVKEDKMTDALIMAAAAIDKKREERRKKIYEFIKEEVYTNNKEIANAFGMSRSTARSDVTYLVSIHPNLKVKNGVGVYYKEDPGLKTLN